MVRDRMRKIAYISLFLFLLLFLTPSLSAWWNVSFTSKLTVNISTTFSNYTPSDPIESMLILNSTNWGTNNCYDTTICKDIAVTWINGTTEQPIPFWVQSYNQTGNTLVWIRAYVLNSSINTFNVYYNSSTAGRSSFNNANQTFRTYWDFENYSEGDKIPMFGPGGTIYPHVETGAHTGTKSMYMADYIGHQGIVSGLGANALNSGIWDFYAICYNYNLIGVPIYLDDGLNGTKGSQVYNGTANIYANTWTHYLLVWNGTGDINLTDSAVHSLGARSVAFGQMEFPSDGGPNSEPFRIDDMIYRNYIPVESVTYNFSSVLHPNIIIALNYPNDGSDTTTNNITFGYTPTFYGSIPVNCSLWTNETNWHMTSLNTTTLSNNSLNTITHNFSSVGTYLWAISCWDQTMETITANRTLNIVNEIPCKTITSVVLTGNLTCPNGLNVTSSGILTTNGWNVSVTGDIFVEGWLDASGTASIINSTGRLILSTNANATQGIGLWNFSNGYLQNGSNSEFTQGGNIIIADFNMSNGTFTGDASSNITVTGNFTFSGGIITNGTLNLVISSPANISNIHPPLPWSFPEPWNHLTLVFSNLTINANTTISGTQAVATQSFYLANGKNLTVSSGGLIYSPVIVGSVFSNLGTITGAFSFSHQDPLSSSPFTVITSGNSTNSGYDVITFGNIVCDVLIINGNLPGQFGWHRLNLSSNAILGSGLYFDVIDNGGDPSDPGSSIDNIFYFRSNNYNLTTKGIFTPIKGQAKIFQSGTWNIGGGITIGDLATTNPENPEFTQAGNINTTWFTWMPYLSNLGYAGIFTGNSSFNLTLSDNFTFPDSACYYSYTCGTSMVWSNINLVMTGDSKTLTFRPPTSPTQYPLNSLTILGNVTILNSFMNMYNLTITGSLNVTNGAITAINLTLGERASLNILNGLLANVTINGTSFWVNGTNFSLAAISSIPSDGLNLVNISKYLNITSLGGGVFDINISYTDAEISDLSESNLRLYEYNGTAWVIVPNSGVDMVNNIVYASNVTSFSLFAPMAPPTPSFIPVYTSQTGMVNTTEPSPKTETPETTQAPPSQELSFETISAWFTPTNTLISIIFVVIVFALIFIVNRYK